MDMDVSGIRYIEVYGHKTVLHTVRGEVAVSQSLAALEEALCRSATYFIYGVFFPALTDGTYRWADIPGFGIPSVVLTLLPAMFCRMLYHKLRGLNPKEYVRLWVIPLFFVLIYLVQTNLYPVGDFTLANGFRIIIGLCAFVTYSQMASAVFQAAKAARETETRAQIAHQLDLQRARVEDMESHAKEMERIRHDRRQHVRVLRGLLEQGNVTEALAYLEDYEGSMADAIQPPLCENFVAAALDAEGGKRFIRLRVQAQEEQVLIRMENGYGGVVYQEGDRFLSSKPGRNRAEGVGIASVRAMAARYGGMADFTYTPDTFTASVLLYMGK